MKVKNYFINHVGTVLEIFHGEEGVLFVVALDIDGSIDTWTSQSCKVVSYDKDRVEIASVSKDTKDEAAAAAAEAAAALQCLKDIKNSYAQLLQLTDDILKSLIEGGMYSLAEKFVNRLKSLSIS